MRNRFKILILLSLLILISSCDQSLTPEKPTEQAAPKNPLVGVWSVTERTTGGEEPETISPARPGLYIFTEGHYSAVYVPGKDARKSSAKSFEPTDEEKVAQHDSLIVNTGTYSVEGDVITFKPIVAKIPEFMGGEAKSRFEIKDEVLTLEILSVRSADGSELANAGGKTKLKKIE